MKGIQSPYTYIGLIFSTFGCHEKDSDMFSIIFNHGDCDKLWYSIKPSGHTDLEKLVEEIAPQLVNKCNKNNLRHKRLMFPQSLLKKRGIPFTRVGRDSIIFRGTLNNFFFYIQIFYQVIQKPGEFIISMPGAYHFGFNLGFSKGEAINIGDKWWLMGPSTQFDLCVCR